MLPRPRIACMAVVAATAVDAARVVIVSGADAAEAHAQDARTKAYGCECAFVSFDDLCVYMCLDECAGCTTIQL